MKCIFCRREQKKPKYKIGDYAVNEINHQEIKYIKIDTIFIYGVDKEITYNGYKEELLREPTEKELEMYFR